REGRLWPGGVLDGPAPGRNALPGRGSREAGGRGGRPRRSAGGMEPALRGTPAPKGGAPPQAHWKTSPFEKTSGKRQRETVGQCPPLGETRGKRQRGTKRPPLRKPRGKREPALRGTFFVCASPLGPVGKQSGPCRCERPARGSRGRGRG